MFTLFYLFLYKHRVDIMKMSFFVDPLSANESVNEFAQDLCTVLLYKPLNLNRWDFMLEHT
jgi:hypothetical protein